MVCPLRTENLSVSFGGLQAVANVSLTVREENIQAIIGPNGAGKTTFFNLISGILRPTGGRIYLFDQDVTQMPWWRRAYLSLGRTFQITNIFPKLTVYENILLAAQSQTPTHLVFYRRLRSYEALTERTNRFLNEFGFWKNRNTLAQNLSYGEQRQLDLMLALINEPKLLLLDEPMSGLSRAEIATVSEMIKTFSNDRTVMIIEHDMDTVFSLAKRIFVLHEGRILADGSPEMIKADSRIKEIYLGEEEV